MIDHRILKKKLACYGLSGSTLQLFHSFLAEREQCVSFNNHLSPMTTIKRGVPQGSVLGPLLFSIYVNDLPLIFHEAICEMFADDTCIHVADAIIALFFKSYRHRLMKFHTGQR